MSPQDYCNRPHTGHKPHTLDSVTHVTPQTGHSTSNTPSEPGAASHCSEAAVARGAQKALPQTRQRKPGDSQCCACARGPRAESSLRRAPSLGGGPSLGVQTQAPTLAAALPDLGAQAAAGHRPITLLQAQVVLLLCKPRRNSRGETSAFDRNLRRRG